MLKSIGIMRESKLDSKGREIESRVVLSPALVKEIFSRCQGIEVFVEKDAGKKIEFSNRDYENAGAKITSHKDVLSKDLVLGVKETKNSDFMKLRANVFFSFQHFAKSKERTLLALKASKQKGAIFVAFETMETRKNNFAFFPCLSPMSEAAAKVVARHADEYALLAKKIITSGLPETGLHGVKTTILGGGSVGKTAAEEFSERGCEVFILEKIPGRAKSLTDYFMDHAIRFPKVSVLEMNPENLRNAVRDSFFLVSAMYISGKKPEKILTVDLLKTMIPGGCVYPVDIDQGGGVEGVIETSILEPFELPVIPGTEVFFFAPPNLPSAGARTSSEALGTVILPYVVEIVNKGLNQAAKDNSIIKTGINIKDGKIAHPGLASVFPDLK
jgi:alanine dehydrogenase